MSWPSERLFDGVFWETPITDRELLLEIIGKLKMLETSLTTRPAETTPQRPGPRPGNEAKERP
jgi:hypothetical protein